MILKKMFSLKWLFTTLLVLAGSALLIRLGLWQLDRLEQRRGFNSQVESMRSMELLELNQGPPQDLAGMEWRAVAVTGEYDFEHQVALRNQYYGDQYGYHLLTPLLFSAAGAAEQVAVLVERGWIPADGNAAPQDWRQYDQAGQVTVIGQIRVGQDQPLFGGVPDPESDPEHPRLDFWNNLNLARISKQLPYAILPVYVQPNVDPGDSQLPIEYQPVLELTEGSHLGYAIQWFAFALILSGGYLYYLRKQESNT